MRFHVGVREVWIQTVEVDADSEEEAKRKVQEGEGEQVNSEYSYTRDSETWTTSRCGEE